MNDNHGEGARLPAVPGVRVPEGTLTKARTEPRRTMETPRVTVPLDRERFGQDDGRHVHERDASREAAVIMSPAPAPSRWVLGLLVLAGAVVVPLTTYISKTKEIELEHLRADNAARLAATTHTNELAAQRLEQAHHIRLALLDKVVLADEHRSDAHRREILGFFVDVLEDGPVKSWAQKQLETVGTEVVAMQQDGEGAASLDVERQTLRSDIESLEATIATMRRKPASRNARSQLGLELARSSAVLREKQQRLQQLDGMNTTASVQGNERLANPDKTEQPQTTNELAAAQRAPRPTSMATPTPPPEPLEPANE